eukprot:TRINITY_DN2707_c0_g8_i1.p1 TRINITY_DN2707_c0_g8~~TRINITY_DN2707_c0_g8_i1.p1  ORF type:complete len:381 (+),score=80.26 TRINITY_DN2707_c0_g8_i1:48-1145(+)
MATSTFNLQSVVRPNIWNLAPYTCARDEFKEAKEVMLDANENALGSCTGGDMKDAKLERYPDPNQETLKQGLCALRGGGLAPENIFLGVGSDEAIDMAIRIFCKPGIDSIMQCPPTYGMYKVSALTNDVGVVNVPLTKSFQLDERNILKTLSSQKNIKIVFICNPNNPTGNLVSTSAIERIAKAFSGIVVVDEAYIDFSKQAGWAARVKEFPNIIVMQTFSKSFGLAGARIGIAYSTPQIISIFNKVKAPYNINALTSSVAQKALSSDAGEMRSKVSLLLAQRERLESVLPGIPVVEKVYPSDSNFLLVKVTNPNKVYNSLASSDVVVRNRCTQPLCDGCLRITVGTPKENDTLIACLRAMSSKL